MMISSIKKTLQFVKGVHMWLGLSAPLPDGLSEVRGRDLLVGSDGTFWVATDEDGVEYVMYRKLMTETEGKAN